MQDIRVALYDLLAAENPMTVRQVFYRMVSGGHIGKTETEYKATVVRLLTEMRRGGDIPFGWIADNTRWMRKPTTDSSLESALHRTLEAYRRSVWDNQRMHVEIWLEKDALSGVLLPVTAAWDVPLMVTRGYPSLTFLHGAAEEMRYIGKPARIYYFGDYDPSGQDIPRKVEAGIREMAPEVDLMFTVVGVTPGQIRQYQLPTRPTKTTDSRSKNFIGESVEVDALPPAVLRDLAQDCIIRHLDNDAYRRLLESEAAERETLTQLMQGWMGS